MRWRDTGRNSTLANAERLGEGDRRFRVADRRCRGERNRNGGDLAAPLGALEAVAEARGAIDARLGRS